MSDLSGSKSAKLALSALQQLGWKARNDANYAWFFDVFFDYETLLIFAFCSSLLQAHDIKLSHLHKKHVFIETVIFSLQSAVPNYNPMQRKDECVECGHAVTFLDIILPAGV